MKTYLKTTALFLTILLINPVLTYAQEIPRHTPGFPDKYLEGLTPSLSKLQEILNLLSNTTLSEVLNNVSMKEKLQNYIRELRTEGKLTTEEVEALKTTLSGNVSVNELMKNIRSEDLRKVMEELIAKYEKGLLKNEDLMKYLNIIAEMYGNGVITTNDYISALNIIKTLTKDKEVITVVDNELLKSMINLLANAGKVSELNALLSTPSVSPSLSFKIPEASNTSRYFEAFKMPSILNVFPSITTLALKDILQYVALATAVFLSLLLLRKFRKPMALLISKTVLSRRENSLENLPEPLKYYWSSVKVVEAYTKVRKLDNVTHREYLSKVSQSLGDLIEEFKKVTQAYELARFGGTVNDEVVKAAREGYVRLVRRL